MTSCCFKSISSARITVKVALICILFSQTLNCFSQSKVDHVERIATFAKVWGGLKYHHPSITNGMVDWDSVMIATIPKIIEAEHKSDYNHEIKKILQFLEFRNKSVLAPENEGEKEIFNWINNSPLNGAVRKELKRIFCQDSVGNQHYIQQSKTGVPFFKNELAYGEMKFPNEEYRLLALSRFWNAIHFFYPYKSQLEEDWEYLLKEFIPRFISVKNEKEYNWLILELVNLLNDGHGSARGTYDLNEGKMYRPAIDIAFTKNETFVKQVHLDSATILTGGFKMGILFLVKDHKI